MSESRRILLVVDGSHQAYETVCYVSSALPPQGTEVVLLYVKSKVPEEFWDLEKDPGWQQKVQTVKNWECRVQQGIECFMEKAYQTFMEENFPPSAVKVDIRAREEGIARDIARESHKGYDSVVIGRRGFSTIKDLSLGGVANKVASKATDLAMWLVGGRPDADKLIIGMDSSGGSAVAIDHVARMTNGADKKVLLLHVIRNPNGENGDPDNAFREMQETRMHRAAEEIKPVLDHAAKKLRASGIQQENISTRIVIGAKSRAGSLLEYAKQGGYGTIVVGRRGLSTVEAFSMGRVSSKLVQAAKDRALWVVG